MPPLDALFDPDTYSDLARSWSAIAYLVISITLCVFASKGFTAWRLQKKSQRYQRRVEELGEEKALDQLETLAAFIGVLAWIVLWIVVLAYGYEILD